MVLERVSDISIRKPVTNSVRSYKDRFERHVHSKPYAQGMIFESKTLFFFVLNRFLCFRFSISSLPPPRLLLSLFKFVYHFTRDRRAVRVTFFELFVSDYYVCMYLNSEIYDFVMISENGFHSMFEEIIYRVF